VQPSVLTTIRDFYVPRIPSIDPQSLDHSLLRRKPSCQMQMRQGLRLRITEFGWREKLLPQRGIALEALLEALWLKQVDSD
jgi:hypothetical protein